MMPNPIPKLFNMCLLLLKEKLDIYDSLMYYSGRIAKAVRLAFHDCVGGCNGCIDPDLEDNAGKAESFSSHVIVNIVNLMFFMDK